MAVAPATGESSPQVSGSGAKESTYLLESRGLTKRFGGLVAVNSVDLVLPRNTILSVIGPNGAGKTTFFNMITGLIKPTAGRLIFDGRDVTGKAPHTVTAVGMARTFQNIRLFANMTALENVLVGMHSRLKATVVGAIFRPPRTRREEESAAEKAYQILESVNLDWASEYAAKSLPYGDQRRLEIARALASNPKLLLLDEPTAGMNPHETATMTRFIKQLQAERGLTVLLIEHDMKVVMGISDHIVVLEYGTKIAEGTPLEVRANPRVIEAYLGRSSSHAIHEGDDSEGNGREADT
jgi:branched-chain amino acid transport system ATP-binding protein